MWGENEGGTKWRCVSKQQGQRQPAACPARCRAVHHRSPARAPHLSRGPLLPRGAPARKSGVPDGLVPVPRTPLPPASLDHSSWERACQVACWIAKLAPTQMTEAVAASAAQSPPLHVSNCCAQSVPSMGSDRGSSSVMLKERKRYCRGGGGDIGAVGRAAVVALTLQAPCRGSTQAGRVRTHKFRTPRAAPSGPPLECARLQLQAGEAQAARSLQRDEVRHCADHRQHRQAKAQPPLPPVDARDGAPPNSRQREQEGGGPSQVWLIRSGAGRWHRVAPRRLRPCVVDSPPAATPLPHHTCRVPPHDPPWRPSHPPHLWERSPCTPPPACPPRRATAGVAGCA